MNLFHNTKITDITDGGTDILSSLSSQCQREYIHQVKNDAESRALSNSALLKGIELSQYFHIDAHAYLRFVT